MPLRRVVILHGYTAHPGKHWFGWLRDQLAPLGVTTEVPALPDTDNPQAGAWTDAAVAAIGRVDSDTAVVGHSLGTITAIRALGRVFAEQPDARLGSLALVATGTPSTSRIRVFGPPGTARVLRKTEELAGMVSVPVWGEPSIRQVTVTSCGVGLSTVQRR